MKMTLFFLFMVSFFSVSLSMAQNPEKRVWENDHSTITEMNGHTVNVVHGSEAAVYDFDLDLFDIYLNPVLPIALIVTYNKSQVMEIEAEVGAGMPPKFMDCKSYILEIPSGKMYPYNDSCSAAVTSIWSPDGRYALNGLSLLVVNAENLIHHLEGGEVPEIRIKGTGHGCGGVVHADSWDWISDDTVTFSGGACGTFFDYSFNLNKKKLSTDCDPRKQKPRYGCSGQ